MRFGFLTDRVDLELGYAVVMPVGLDFPFVGVIAQIYDMLDASGRYTADPSQCRTALGRLPDGTIVRIIDAPSVTPPTFH